MHGNDNANEAVSVEVSAGWSHVRNFEEIFFYGLAPYHALFLATEQSTLRWHSLGQTLRFLVLALLLSLFQAKLA